MFYPKVKKNISPSAIASFFENPQGFKKTYFEGVRIENKYTRRGKEVHKLVEGGFYTPNLKFDTAEERIEFLIDDIKKGLSFVCYPDSHNGDINTEHYGNFVDYKSVSEKTKGNWNETKVNKDIKQACYAWAMWVQTGRPDEFKVTGSIELILVNEDGNPVETIAVFDRVYTAEDCIKTEKLIKEMVKGVEKLYKEWEAETEVPVDELLLADYLEAVAKEKEAITLKKDLASKIVEELQAGGGRRAIGFDKAFYLRPYTRYSYPEDLEVIIDGTPKKLKDIEEVIAGYSDQVASAKADHKQFIKPDTVSYSIGISKA